MLYVVRHGQTDWNKRKVMQGQTDIPLNEEGIKQAKLLREKLKDITFDAIFCSPLIRAKQTCEIIAGVCNATYDKRIIERNYGEFENREKKSFDYNEFWSYSLNKEYKKAEKCKDFLIES